MINKERAINKFMELVQIDSVSYNERGVADYLINYFSDLGYEVVEDKHSNEKVPKSNAGYVIVRVPGKGDLANNETLILEAHMDTVEPGNGVKPSISEDGKYVVSDGTTILGADDKAGNPHPDARQGTDRAARYRLRYRRGDGLALHRGGASRARGPCLCYRAKKRSCLPH